MHYQANFTGWQNLILEDLVVAYRKAKADYFFENTFATAIKFAESLIFFIEEMDSLFSQSK